LVHLREQFHVDAPAEAVWDLVTDTQRLVEWQSGLVEVKDPTGKLDRVGAAFSPVYRFAATNFPSIWTPLRSGRSKL
jgi:Polyketide cyclase / dehydrase and lipid transport.